MENQPSYLRLVQDAGVDPQRARKARIALLPDEELAYYFTLLSDETRVANILSLKLVEAEIKARQATGGQSTEVSATGPIGIPVPVPVGGDALMFGGFVDKFISVQRSIGKETDVAGATWQTLPNCAKVLVWASSIVETVEAERHGSKRGQRFLFHIAFTPLIAAGNRINYLGQHFNILEVSESRVLTGLELKAERIFL